MKVLLIILCVALFLPVEAGSIAWPMDELRKTPTCHPAAAYETNGVKVAFYDGLPYRGKPTRIFCYYGVPKHTKGAKVPGMVLVHGGGGSAFYRWVKFWNDRGYAAISMDTCGSVSGNTVGDEQRRHFRHSDGGPAGWGGFDQLGEDVRDQWLYHAVGAAILGNSFLRSLEGVDPDRIGLTGVSWGGVIACIAASQDDRFRFAAPVYGCGAFWDKSPMWVDEERKIGCATAEKWCAIWDPIHYLPAVKIPVHWLAGTNDRAFAVPALMRSYRAVRGEKGLSLKVRLPHAHGKVSEEAPELLAVADHYLNGKPMPKAVRAELNYTTDSASDWTDRKWLTIPARLVDGRPRGEVPPDATAFYYNVIDTTGASFSTPVEDGHPVVDVNPVRAKWISGDTAAPEKAAPYLGKRFKLSALPRKAVFDVAVAGWHELYVNGRRIGEDVLTPATCQPDRRLSSVAHDVTDALVVGDNEIAVLLGNGWWNCFTKEVWGYSEAPWMAAPQIKGTLVADGKPVLVTDGSWRAWDSPIVFNALRNGEYYDARNEGKKANERAAQVVKYVPWAEVSAEDVPPCRVFESYEPVATLPAGGGGIIYDFKYNISGWCEIDVAGEAGAKVAIDYDEWLEKGNVFHGNVIAFQTRAHDPRPGQHDEYVLAGKPEGETWHARFTYHGFRYARVRMTGKVTLKAIRARFVHTDLKTAGRLKTSDPTFERIQDMTIRSYLSNFIGIPTDCPHREKIGWTGDAQHACMTGLWNFDSASGYRHFVQMIVDAQRPSGAVPCILPCTPKYGFFWGSGPSFDAALFEIPWQLYRFTGDDSAARKAYPAMKRYLGFIMDKVEDNGCIYFGLGDWCAPRDVPVRASERDTDTAYCYEFNREAAFWADRFGDPIAAEHFRTDAARLKAAHNRMYSWGSKAWGTASPTSIAAPLFFPGLCKDGEEKPRLEALVRTVREKDHKSYFGTLGMKWIPRVLAENGFVDDAWKIYTQPEFPGMGHWVAEGATTLHENFNDSTSLNHIMFGDVSAWAYEYVGGIHIVEPGFAKVELRPLFPVGVDRFAVEHAVAGKGKVVSGWERKDGKVSYVCRVPKGVLATVCLPDRQCPVTSGERMEFVFDEVGKNQMKGKQ